ncbi:MAG: response regulator transcription factor [Deltaproteobacteria bacterium]|nr:response regulator transcription factor [Deltaproteobacteria bacterium]
MRIRVLVVEDQPKILKAQIKLLETFEEIEIVGEALSGESALAKIDELKPEVVLLDLGLPQMDGIEVTRRLRARHPEIEILIFTIFDEEDKVLSAVTAGAAGYLLKGTPVEKIVEAIRDVKAGGAVIQPNLARALLRLVADNGRSPAPDSRPRGPGSTGLLGDDSPDASSSPAGARGPSNLGGPAGKDARAASASSNGISLTNRELEILQIVAKGLSNQEAARVIGLSRATIRTHLEHVYEKLDVSNRVEAVAEGIRQGLIQI